MKKPKGLRLLVVASDIHAGSTVAVLPPRLELAEGLVVEANPLQRFYWKAWQHALGWVHEVANGDPFGLILNGDLIEGDHHRTDQIIGRNLSDHLKAAEEILRPLAGAASRVFITRGTECHVGDTEAALGQIFQAEKNPATGRRVFDRLTLDIAGIRLVARHHVSTTSRPWLESNGLGMELASEQLQAVRNGEPMPRVLCVAHRHVGGHVTTNEGLCLATPAWQGLTRHGHKVVGAARCKPGLYVLDWRGIPDGELPRVHRRIYDAPQPQAVAA